MNTEEVSAKGAFYKRLPPVAAVNEVSHVDNTLRYSRYFRCTRSNKMRVSSHRSIIALDWFDAIGSGGIGLMGLDRTRLELLMVGMTFRWKKITGTLKNPHNNYITNPANSLYCKLQQCTIGWLLVTSKTNKSSGKLPLAYKTCISVIAFSFWFPKAFFQIRSNKLSVPTAPTQGSLLLLFLLESVLVSSNSCYKYIADFRCLASILWYLQVPLYRSHTLFTSFWGTEATWFFNG